MAVHEFVYFPFAGGRGEPARIAFHASGVQWKDTRIAFADLGAAKAEGKYLTGLPVLKLPSGKAITQSIAITRYAAKLGDSGLYPTDPEAALVVDMAMDIAQDALTKCPQDADAEVKKAKREEYAAGKLKAFCGELAGMIEATEGPFLTGANVTVGDLVVYYFIVAMIEKGDFDHVPATYLEQFPQFKNFGENVLKSAPVEKYYASQ